MNTRRCLLVKPFPYWCFLFIFCFATAYGLELSWYHYEPNGSNEYFVIIHGRGASKDSDYIQGLAAAVHNREPNSRIYLLDWSELASSSLGWTGFGGEDNIPTVGKYLAERLQNIPATKINLIGHSWGALVSYEAAKFTFLNRNQIVNSIIAIEPAENVPTGYDTSLAIFNKYSLHTWSLTTPNLASSAITPITANESFVILGSDHTQLVRDFTNMLYSPLGDFFLSFERLFSGLKVSNVLYNMLNYYGQVSYNSGYDMLIDRVTYKTTAVLKPILNLSVNSMDKTLTIDWNSRFNFKMLYSTDINQWREVGRQPAVLSEGVYQYKFLTPTNSNYYFKLSDEIW